MAKRKSKIAVCCGQNGLAIDQCHDCPTPRTDPAEVTVTIKIDDLVHHVGTATMEFNAEGKLDLVVDESTKAVMNELNKRFKFRKTEIKEA